MSLSPGNEQQFYYGSEVGKKEGSRNYAGVESEVVDFLIEQLIGAQTREELTTAIHALDRVLLWGHYVIPVLIHSADPFQFWLPKDIYNERWLELKEKPNRYYADASWGVY